MKDLSLRSPVTLSVSLGATTPVPPAGEYPIIWSTSENSFLEWSGTSWQLVGFRVNSITLPASENLTAGNLVNIHNASGASVRKAISTSNEGHADGFVLNNYTAGNSAVVYLSGLVKGLSGLTVGQLWLGTSGGVTGTAPTANLSQQVGYAISATQMLFIRGTPVFINP